MLVVGCGTGRHDREFYMLGGYVILGIDISAEMVGIAKTEADNLENANLRYMVGDARQFSVDDQYDAAVSLFHVMSYQRTNDDIKNVLRSVSNAINKDGIFIFDAWYGPGVLRDLPSVRVKTVEDDEYKFIRTAEPDLYPNENAVDVNYHICMINKHDNIVTEIDEKHPMRYYFKPEIEEFLNEEGFELIAYLDCNTLQEPTFDSWTAYFVCRKI